MYSIRVLFAPQCREQRAPATDDDGRELLLTRRPSNDELRPERDRTAGVSAATTTAAEGTAAAPLAPAVSAPTAADAPSPVPGAQFTPEVLAKLATLEERSKQHARDLRPENTTSGYAADWKHWQTFCDLLGLPVTAITPGTLTAFVEWLWWQPGWRPGTYTAPTTIDRRLSGVVVTGRTEYDLALDRRVASRAREVLKAKVKAMETTGETRGRGPANALLVPQLRNVIAAAPENRAGLRNRAIVLIHYAITGREHEVAYLRQRHLVEVEHGLEVDVRVSKTKPRKVKVPYGSRPSTCPVRAWRAWKESAGLDDPDDFAFKPLHNRWHTLLPGGLEPETIGDVLTKLAQRADLPLRYTGHSPRRGAAESSRRAGNDRKVIARQGGWVENSAAMEGYFDAGEGWEENAMIGVL